LSLADLVNAQLLTAFDLLLHHCWDVELQPQLPVSIEVIDALEAMVRDIPSYLLDATPPEALPPRSCSAGVLMSTLAWHCVQGNDLMKICECLDVYPSDAEVLRQNLVRLLQASADLHAAADPLADPVERRLREQFCGPSLASRIRRLGIQLEHGLPGDAVYLTLIPGCGGRLARRLLEARITNLEDLCNQEPSDLTAIPGMGPKRATTWIEAAARLIKDFEPDPIPIAPCRARSITAPSDWPSDIDPGRLQRASTLKVDGGPHTYWVTGGAEEHCVAGDACDCADFAQHEPGWWCKHRLAVRLANNERKLKALVARLTDLRPPPSLAGHLADLALGRRWHHA
jgi:Helix-hairpin-helix domain